MPDPIPEIAINGRFLQQPITGVQRVARELTREIDSLVAEGSVAARLRLLCPPGTPTGDLALRATAIETVDGPGGSLWEQIALPRAVGDAHLLCLGNVAPIVSLLGRKPVALLIHDLSYRNFPQAYRRRYRLFHALMMPLLLRYASPLITVSESERGCMRTLRSASARTIIVAQNGGWSDFDKRQVARAAGPGQTGSYLLYVGSLSRRKNFEGLLQVAIRAVREENLDFVFVGSMGPILTPTEISLPPDVRDRVTFAGQIDDMDVLAGYYANARCLVYPSFYEASPLPPLEAMRFGCPVVSSRIPSMLERCGDAAEYCDPTQIEDIVRAIRKVVRNPEYARELIARGDALLDRYSWRKQAETVLAAILTASAVAATPHREPDVPDSPAIASD